jgi:membrane peptidoglycan carboxypeptidase
MEDLQDSPLREEIIHHHGHVGSLTLHPMGIRGIHQAVLLVPNHSPRESMDDISQRARSALRRARSGVSQMYEAVSREVRARVERGRAPRSSRVPDQVYNSLPDRPRDELAPSYDMDMPPEQALRPARPRSVMMPESVPEAPPRQHRSLAVRLRKRRNKVRGTPASRAMAIFTRSSIIIFAAVVILVGGFLGYHTSDLNTRYGKNIAMLTQQKDNQITRIYDRHGVLLAELTNNDVGGRTYLTYCQLPTNILKATVDTEDATFWDNPLGIDILATIKALTRDTGGGAISGASTITQQVVKNVILADSSRTGLQGLQRKLDEALLSMEITQQYSKTDILTLYLDTIPYGGTVLGIESAAQNYFHLKQKTLDITPKGDRTGWTDADWAYYKHVTDSTSGCQVPANQESVVEPAAWQLANWQAMLLAGVPQSPACHNPNLRPHDVLVRFRDGVLPNVAKHDLELINDSPAYADPKKVQIHDYSNNLDGMSNYVYSQIRTGQGDETDQTKGIGAICSNYDDFPANPPKIPTGYVRGIFGSSGVNGQQRVLAPYFVDYVKEELASKIGNIDQYIGQGWNIYTSLDYGNPDLTQAQLESIYIDHDGNLASDGNKLNAEQLKTVGMQQYAETVVNRNITGGVNGTYPDWWYCGLSSGSTVVQYGGPYARDKVNPFEPDQPVCERKALNIPSNQGGRNVGNGALVALDPRNGDILAMVGGADYYQMNDKRAGQLNMTIQPRSLGSSFKPIVYATAMEMGWNPGIIIPDEPTCFPSAPPSNPTAADKSICPNNYLAHNYTITDWNGFLPLTELLGNSLNTPAALTLQFTGLQGEKSPLLAMAQRMGITTLSASRLGPTTALGAQEIPLIQETEAYATLANNGVHEPSRAILEVTDFQGNLVKDASGQPLFAYDPNPPGGQAISPQAAYQVTSILTNNEARYGDFGSRNPLHFWNRDVAAKTGTSELIKDLATMGYTPGLAIGTWSGNDDDTPTDPNILGIAGAAYIFNAVMAFGIIRLNLPGTKPSKFAPATPGGYFAVPSDMHRAQLSCMTGMAPYQGEDVTKECKPYDHTPTPQYMAEFGTKTTWACTAWGCNKSDTGPIPGTNIAWMVNGQDPLVP